MPPAIKQELSATIHHRYFNRLSSVFLALLYLNFIVAHAVSIAAGTISPSVIVFLAMETVVLFFIIIRPNPASRTIEPLPWIFALLGTFLPLTLQPSETVVHELLGTTLVLIGGLLAVGSYLSLNTSIGITPALRKVKTSGLYAYIRHPMYFSYTVLFTGYLCLSFSALNLLIVGAAVFCFTQRIRYEEAFLKQDEQYRTYHERVRFRMIPFIY